MRRGRWEHWGDGLQGMWYDRGCGGVRGGVLRLLLLMHRLQVQLALLEWPGISPMQGWLLLTVLLHVLLHLPLLLL